MEKEHINNEIKEREDCEGGLCEEIYVWVLGVFCFVETKRERKEREGRERRERENLPVKRAAREGVQMGEGTF